MTISFNSQFLNCNLQITRNGIIYASMKLIKKLRYIKFLTKYYCLRLFMVICWEFSIGGRMFSTAEHYSQKLVGLFLGFFYIHPLNSFDLVPIDYHLFCALKRLFSHKKWWSWSSENCHLICFILNVKTAGNLTPVIHLLSEKS